MFIDDMEYDDCWELWNAITTNPVLTARALFPNRQPMYVQTTKLLGRYLANKGTALGMSKHNKVSENDPRMGLHERRAEYINIAAKIYTTLPAWARTVDIDFLNPKDDVLIYDRDEDEDEDIEAFRITASDPVSGTVLITVNTLEQEIESITYSRVTPKEMIDMGKKLIEAGKNYLNISYYVLRR